MDETIYYNSPVGLLQIKNSGNNISGVFFTDEPVTVLNNPGERTFAKPQSPVIKICIEQLNDYFSGKLFEFNLPIEQTGTAFQQEVWKALLKIPYGKTKVTWPLANVWAMYKQSGR